ncbi:MAG: hypothetical protein GOU99_00430 [Candidatus Altiarchaeota archaeon]|nr:hypothetical protein [Candidatus Altiarchaeota archaeon]
MTNGEKAIAKNVYSSAELESMGYTAWGTKHYGYSWFEKDNEIVRCEEHQGKLKVIDTHTKDVVRYAEQD